jgi:hypothetical protein
MLLTGLQTRTCRHQKNNVITVYRFIEKMKVHTVYENDDDNEFNMYKDGEVGDVIHYLPDNQEGIKHYRIVMIDGKRDLQQIADVYDVFGDNKTTHKSKAHKSKAHKSKAHKSKDRRARDRKTKIRRVKKSQ